MLAEQDGVEIERPLIPAIRFDVRAITDADALIDYRFTGPQIIRIAQGLRLPECIITDARDRVSCYEALAMLLKRLAFPCRLSSLRKSFGRSEGVCCRVTLCVASLIMDSFHLSLSELELLLMLLAALLILLFTLAFTHR
ncbi:hypothetical protein PF003_g29105 [Phytophthora fragariae]|nr:hypothetical protein PF003_g29105 [Phytophthora fragariae]